MLLLKPRPKPRNGPFGRAPINTVHFQVKKNLLNQKQGETTQSEMPSYSIYEDLNVVSSCMQGGDTIDPSSCMDCNADDELIHNIHHHHHHESFYNIQKTTFSSSTAGSKMIMPTTANNLSYSSSKSYHLLNTTTSTTTSHTKQATTLGFIDLNVHSSLLSFGDNKENIDPMTGRVYPVLQPLSMKSKSSNNPHLQRNPLKDITQQVLGVNRKQSNTFSTPTSSEKNSANRKLPGSRSSGNPLSPSALYLR